MRRYEFDAAIDLVVAGNGVEQSFAPTATPPRGDIPFRAGATVVAAISSVDLAGDAVITLEGRQDSTSAFSALSDTDGVAISFAIQGTRYYEFVLTQEVRVVVTETTGVGSAEMTFLAN